MLILFIPDVNFIILHVLLQMGLRDGLAEGQETVLQQGFNVGYQQSALLSSDMAELRGKLRCVRYAKAKLYINLKPIGTTGHVGLQLGRECHSAGLNVWLVEDI